MKLVVEELSKDHLEYVFTLYQNEEVCKLSGVDRPRSYDDMWQIKYIDGDHRSYAHEGCSYHAYIAYHQQKPVGTLGYHFDPDTKEMVEFGLTVDPAYWGMGIGKAMVLWLFKRAFRKLGSKKVFCYVHEDNLRSNALMTSMGMRHVEDEDDDGERYLVYRITKQKFDEKYPQIK